MHRREASRSHILRRSLDSVENERARIAVELHNETSQNLVALKVRLATARRVLAKGLTEDALGILEDCSRISDEILSGVNRLATDLRPSELAYLGLRQAIEAAAEARLSRKSISFSVIGNATDVHFSALQESMLLSGVIEALSNCAQHSHASHVEVEMHDDGSWFTVSVRDDGQGFDTGLSEGTGYGLKSMSDCASAIGGYFWIGSTSGVGTNVRFSVPTMYLEEDDGE
nr:ATP-binding protein [Adlercreutzia sp. ZJ473]